MTKEEAIEKVKFLCDNACSYYLGRENAIALNVAIEALEQIKAIESIIGCIKYNDTGRCS